MIPIRRFFSAARQGKEIKAINKLSRSLFNRSPRPSFGGIQVETITAAFQEALIYNQFMDEEISITAEPLSAASCQFTVDRPVLAGRSYYFANPETAEKSPLARSLFEIPGIKSVLIRDSVVTVESSQSASWRDIGPPIGQAIRTAVTEAKIISEELFDQIPPAEEIRSRVQKVITDEINPAVASHGGWIDLIDVKTNEIFVRLGGGCQGCGSAALTLKQGVERLIREAVPEVGAILDTTDHAAGRNPYFAP